MKRRTSRLFTVVTTAFVGVAAAQADAIAAEPSDAEFAAAVAQLLRAEDSALLSGAASRSLPAATSSGQAKLALRQAVNADRAYAARVAGAEITDVVTTSKVEKAEGSGSVRTVQVTAHTSTSTAGGASGTVERHTVTFQRSGDAWKIADIDSPDEASPYHDAILAGVAGTPAAQRQAAISDRIKPLRESLERNGTALRSGDRTKLAGARVAASDTVKATDAGEVAARSDAGRPASRPLPGPVPVATPMGGEGAPYNYQAMVDYAYHYSINPVGYTRDSNDCTTFISWALWTGRYEEHGSQSYPAVGWNHDDYDVWYWRSSDGNPRHSYTWGGARNWNVFENNYGGRASFLSYLDDLLVSDVMQLEIDGYGETDAPDHTMMVTGRGGDGWPLLSYHSTDTQNKPFWDILAVHDGPYWGIRT
jgi:hypothetical protein